MEFNAAYVFIKCKPKKVSHVFAELQKIEAVLEASIITGQFDIAALIYIGDDGDLLQIIGDIQSIDGVRETSTSFVADYYHGPHITPTRQIGPP